MTDAELKQYLSTKLDQSLEETERFLQAFRDAFVEAFLTDGYLTIKYIGKFSMRPTRTEGGLHGRIKFISSSLLRAKFEHVEERHDLMEKLGVTTSTTKAKAVEARLSGKCPDCGAELTKDGSKLVLCCPNCGTLPFEDPPISSEEQENE